jgi:CRISPR-associated endonuclease/helicase Cas3
LREHLEATAELAAKFGAAFGAADLTRLAGRWHDLGKYDQAWQRYLRAQVVPGEHAGRSPDHRRAGAIRAAEAGLTAVAFAIAGHHGGIPSQTDLKAWLDEAKRDAGANNVIRRALTAADADGAPGLAAALLVVKQQPAERLRFEMFTRLVFSALVDADFLDTEAHLSPTGRRVRERPHGAIGMKALFERLVEWRRKRTVVPSPVQVWREQWREEVATHAGDPPGVFRLALPTGAGKTLTGLEFALAHAVAHGLRRVVIAVPFLTITEQVAQVYREALGDPGDGEIVLEQHSGALDAESANQEDVVDGPTRWARLASENWDAPVVVTTTVSLFESLLGNRPGRSRRVHRLARSVVIVDEVQALPTTLVEPLMQALHDLAAVGAATVVLCTATQPSFEAIKSLRDVEATDLVRSAVPVPDAFRRVQYEWHVENRSGWSEVAGWLREHTQALAIVNTRRHAHELLDALGDHDALHLSTLMCGAHRNHVLGRVRADLSEGRPCRLVATQVVEAGVDVDFPLVVRALGPWDAIVQASGRCNREGKRERGVVRVFVPPDDASPPGAYSTGIGVTRQLAGRDPDDPEASAEYFRRLFANVDTDLHKVGEARTRLDFPEVSKLVRLVDEDGVPAIVASYGGEATRAHVRELIERLEHEPERMRHTRRLLAPYVVNVGRRAADEARRRGWLQPVSSTRGAPEEWLGQYDPVRGLVMGDLAPGDLIV